MQRIMEKMTSPGKLHRVNAFLGESPPHPETDHYRDRHGHDYAIIECHLKYYYNRCHRGPRGTTHYAGHAGHREGGGINRERREQSLQDDAVSRP